MKKSKEMKIYESIGIRKFKILISKICDKFDKKEKKTNDLKKEKKKIKIKTLISTSLIIILFPILIKSTEISIPLTVFFSIITTLNIQFIILQRYNFIRINNIINKQIEKQKKSIKEELKNKDSKLKEHSYKIIDKNKNETYISLNELMENASLDELKQYRKYFVCFENINGQLGKNKTFKSDEINIIAPMEKEKKLKLKINK